MTPIDQKNDAISRWLVGGLTNGFSLLEKTTPKISGVFMLEAVVF